MTAMALCNANTTLWDVMKSEMAEWSGAEVESICREMLEERADEFCVRDPNHTSMKSDDGLSEKLMPMARSDNGQAISLPNVTTRRLVATDPKLFTTSSGVETALGKVTKNAAAPLFGEDQPWELAWWNTYPSVVYDATQKIFKMWYNSNINCSTAFFSVCPHLNYSFPRPRLGGQGGATLYAESTHAGGPWHKPSLGLNIWNGSKENNIAVSTPGDPNRGVFLDKAASTAERYKMFGLFGGRSGPAGLGTMSSADGKVWNPETFASAMAMQVTANTANIALFDADLGKYLAFSRKSCYSTGCTCPTCPRANCQCPAAEWGKWGQRRVTRSVSTRGWGSGNWTAGVEILHGEAGYESYSLAPFRLPQWPPGVYLGVASFYNTTDSEGKHKRRVHSPLLNSLS
jgi:hypothetical protein